MVGPGFETAGIVLGGVTFAAIAIGLYRWIFRLGSSESAMKRRWNWPIWVGLVVVVTGLFSYGFFVRFPTTRDFPWANLLLFGIGAALLLVGLFRAFGRPQLYRGKDFRLDLRSDCCARCRVFQLCNLLRRATGAGFNWRAARWPKGARLFTTGSKWKSCRSRRFALGAGGTQGGRTDFLSRFLVTAMQLRVAEFSAKAAGVRGAWHSCCRHQRRSAGYQPAAIAKARVHVSAAVRSECEGYSPIRCACIPGRDRKERT